MRSKILCVGFNSVLFAAFAAQADDAVVVTATRSEQALSQVGQSLSIIDAAAITRRQTDTVIDLLRNVPGVSFTRNGGIGTTTSVFIRGAESDQTVTLIDGVKLNDPSAPGGGFNFADLFAGNISRIEVLRGSQSVLWGSQAIGGVVNVITDEPTDALSGTARAEYGWRDTRQVVGNISQRLGPVGASIGVGSFRTDGISAFDEHLGGREQDGYRDLAAHGKVNIAVSDLVSLDLRAWYSDGTVGIDGFPPPTFTFGDTREYSKTRELVAYSGLNVAMFDGRLHNRLAFAYTRTKRDNFDPDGDPVQTFDSLGRNERVEYQGTLDINARVRSIFGAEMERSHFTTSSFGGPVTRGDTQIDSGYIEIITRPFTGLTAIAGVRHDQHDEFGGKTTLSASSAWSPNGGNTAVRASYSEGFKAPTLYQLQSEYGNALLHPEFARGGDVGVVQKLWAGRVEMGATAFLRRSSDLINFVSCPDQTGICTDRPFGTYDNVAKARSQGVEVSSTLIPVDALRIEANYSYIDAQNRSPGSVTFGRRLVRRPNNTASALLDYDWAYGFSTGLTVTHSGATFNDAANTLRVSGYTVVDVRVAWAVGQSVRLQARVENLFNREYETVYQYGMPGRAAFAGALFSF